MKNKVLISLATAGLVAACAHQGGTGDGAAVAPPDTVTGVVRQVGSVPFLMTVVQGEDTAAVSGELEEEISRLVGARVRVMGVRSTGSFPGPTVQASEYRILSIDGEEPTVGILRQDEGGVYLELPEDGEARRMGLSAVPDGLRRRIGAKVWVITSAEGGSVLRYGVLRPAESGDSGDGG